MRAGCVFSRRGLVAGLAFGAQLVFSGAIADEPYRLQAGDSVAMNVAGVPDLSIDAQVQLDGSLSLPMVGEVQAEGRTIGEVREAIRTAVASQLVPVYTSDGQEYLRTVTRAQVSVSITGYQPVVVSGDVARPGELRYRPGLTVRQAIAAAGGQAIVSGARPTASVPELEADYAGAWNALAATEARIWRLGTELGGQAEFDPAVLPPMPDNSGSLDKLLQVETDLRQTRAQDEALERAFQRRSLDQTDRQTKLLKRQLEVERTREEADAADLKVAEEAGGKAIYTQSRMADIRGAALLSATRRLETEANLMQIERRRSEVARELERLDDRRRFALLDELQQAQVKRGADRARLNAIAARLQEVGIAVPAVGQATEPTAAVVRPESAAPFAVPLDWELRPGDVVLVSRGTGGEALIGAALAATDAAYRMDAAQP